MAANIILCVQFPYPISFTAPVAKEHPLLSLYFWTISGGLNGPEFDGIQGHTLSGGLGRFTMVVFNL